MGASVCSHSDDFFTHPHVLGRVLSASTATLPACRMTSHPDNALPTLTRERRTQNCSSRALSTAILVAWATRAPA